MALQTYLKRRNGSTYYARMVVPLDLQDVVGKRELAKSLGTSKPTEAKRLVRPVIEAWEREFEALRKRRELVDSDFAEATWEHYVTELELDEAGRTLAGSGELAAGQELAAAATSRAYLLKEMTAHLARGETVLIHWAADAYIAKRRLLVEKGSPQYKSLCFRLMRAKIEQLKRADERDLGDFTGKPADPIVVRPAATAEVAKPGETILELFETYAKENPKAIAEATLGQARRDIGTFVDLVGRDFPVSAIDKKAVREWKALLQRFPVKATEQTIFKGLSFRQIVEANDKAEKPKPVITAKTVNRYMAGFGAFCNWLAAHDYIPANPFADMYLRVDKTKTTTEVFTAEQRKALFASPLFVGCQSDRDWHVPGEHLIRDHRYWLPHLMMWSGARPGELAQLLLDDVRQMHGVWVMHITDEGDDEKSVKNKGSFRVVPVHSKLIEMGFVRHVEAQREAGERRVFPEAERNSRGQIAASFEKKFGTYLTKLGIKDGRGLSLYSFRHGWADAMRTAGLMDEEFGFLMGHSKQSMTARYGQLPQGTLQKRVELIEAVTY